MEYPTISNCSVCGKKMAQFRSTKIYCGRKCQQRAYRIRHNLPLTWKPDPTKRKEINGAYQNPIRQMGGGGMPTLPLNWNKGINNGIAYDCQILKTDKGIRKVYVNKTSGEVIVFEVKDGKEILIK